MATKKTKTPPPDEPYTNIEMRLVCADSFRIRNTGEVITWKPDMLRVYLYLFNQCQGFENSGGKFFQKREKIWKCCGVSHDRLDKILKSLLKLGLIKDTGERRTAPGAPRGMVVYTAFRLMAVIKNLEIAFADDNGEPVWDHERASGKKKSKKSEEKQEDGKSDDGAIPQAETQAEQAAKQAEPTNQPAATPTNQNPGVASGSAPDASEQQSGVASNDDSGGNDGSDDHHSVSHQQTADRVIASLDDLRYWSDVGGSEGLDDYGAIWGVSGTALYNLIAEHLQIREAEAEKNFKSQRAH